MLAAVANLQSEQRADEGGEVEQITEQQAEGIGPHQQQVVVEQLVVPEIASLEIGDVEPADDRRQQQHGALRRAAQDSDERCAGKENDRRRDSPGHA